jgi:thiamine biosynthesis protein ThiI
LGDSVNQKLALLRFSGEVGTKARATRTHFRNRLLSNLRDALSSHGMEGKIEVSHDRLYIPLPEDAPQPEAGESDHPLARVFGLQSISWVERHPVKDVADVVRIGESLFRDRVKGRRFAVRCRRIGSRKVPQLRPHDIDVALGAALLDVSAGVDLDDPEVTVRIEVSRDSAAFFAEQQPGPGGLPLGVEGSAISLISGGFDSAVASWQMLKRGVALDYVFCNMGGPTHLQGVVRVAKHLADNWSYGDRPRLHVVDFEPVADALRQHTARRYWQVLLKRMMLRAASGVGRRKRAPAIVTGDAVGQVSSQTLQNLTVISSATRETILRPLVGMNKDEIVAIARRIGTFDLSSVVGEYCAMVPTRPATRAALDVIENEEARMPEGVLERVVESRTIFDLRELDMRSLAHEGLSISHLPEGALLIDLRPLEQYRSEHHPEALHLEFAKALEACASFDKSRSYVLSCQFGLLSAHLAERMRSSGLDAYHFEGGQRALMAQVA